MANSPYDKDEILARLRTHKAVVWDGVIHTDEEELLAALDAAPQHLFQAVPVPVATANVGMGAFAGSPPIANITDIVNDYDLSIRGRMLQIGQLQDENGRLQQALAAMTTERDAAMESVASLQAVLDAAMEPAAAVSNKAAEAATTGVAATNSPSPTPAAETPPVDTPAAGTPLPLDFPKLQELATAGITTVGGVKATAPADLLKIPGIGQAAATAISERIAAL